MTLTRLCTLLLVGLATTQAAETLPDIPDPQGRAGMMAAVILDDADRERSSPRAERTSQASHPGKAGPRYFIETSSCSARRRGAGLGAKWVNSRSRPPTRPSARPRPTRTHHRRRGQRRTPPGRRLAGRGRRALSEVRPRLAAAPGLRRFRRGEWRARLAGRQPFGRRHRGARLGSDASSRATHGGLAGLRGRPDASPHPASSAAMTPP